MARVSALVGLLAMALPASAYAQGAPPLPAFRPDVTFGVVFDDNVFMRPEGQTTSDVFIRLTPGFELVHDSTRVTLNGSFRFDAERYQERSDLNEAVARQATAFSVTWRPNRRFALISRAGYQRTTTPLDLNTATGLTGGRQPASRTDLSVEFEHTIRPRRRLSVGGEYAYDDILTAIGVDSSLRAARVRFTEELDPRSQLYFNYRFEQREFIPGRVILSHVGVAGWVYRVSRSLRVTVEGGPRLADEQWAGDFMISAVQTINDITSFSASYVHTQDVAIGVIGLITIDRLTASVALRRSRFWELIMSAGAFRNLQAGADTLAYDASVSVGRSLTNAFWLVASFNRTFNDVRVAGAALPNTEIARNWALISLRIQPFRPR